MAGGISGWWAVTLQPLQIPTPARGAKISIAFREYRCGSSPIINRYFFVFSQRACAPRMVSGALNAKTTAKDMSQSGPETRPQQALPRATGTAGLAFGPSRHSVELRL